MQVSQHRKAALESRGTALTRFGGKGLGGVVGIVALWIFFAIAKGWVWVASSLVIWVGYDLAKRAATALLCACLPLGCGQYPNHTESTKEPVFFHKNLLPAWYGAE